MGRRWWTSACFLVWALAAGPAAGQRTPAATGDGGLEAGGSAPIQGVFLLDRSAGDSVEDIIDRGVGLLAWYKRPFARGRLRETTRPEPWVAIDPDSVGVRVRTGLHDLSIPWNGGLRDWEWKPNDFIDVEAAWDGRDLLQTFRGSDGTRYNRYVLSDDGRTLELRVRIESDQLAEPLRYRLVYVRREEPAVSAKRRGRETGAP